MEPGALVNTTGVIGLLGQGRGEIIEGLLCPVKTKVDQATLEVRLGMEWKEGQNQTVLFSGNQVTQVHLHLQFLRMRGRGRRISRRLPIEAPFRQLRSNAP